MCDVTATFPRLKRTPTDAGRRLLFHEPPVVGTIAVFLAKTWCALSVHLLRRTPAAQMVVFFVIRKYPVNLFVYFFFSKRWIASIKRHEKCKKGTLCKLVQGKAGHCFAS